MYTMATSCRVAFPLTLGFRNFKDPEPHKQLVKKRPTSILRATRFMDIMDTVLLHIMGQRMSLRLEAHALSRF
jgi:hypothetical protein